MVDVPVLECVLGRSCMATLHDVSDTGVTVDVDHD